MANLKSNKNKLKQLFSWKRIGFILNYTENSNIKLVVLFVHETGLNLHVHYHVGNVRADKGAQTFLLADTKVTSVLYLRLFHRKLLKSKRAHVLL